jgi:tyrosine-protein phosphatase YwqE
MIDLHCHLRPGRDDGAPNLAKALMLARATAAPSHASDLLSAQAFLIWQG